METLQADIKVFLSHLEFFGYSDSEFFEDESGFKVVHEGFGKLFVRKFGRNIAHTTYWFISDNTSKDDVELLKIVNDLNAANYVSTYSVTDDNGLRIDAVYSGEYSKPSYGEFITDYHHDILRAVNSNSDLKNYQKQQQLALVN